MAQAFPSGAKRMASTNQEKLLVAGMQRLVRKERRNLRSRDGPGNSVPSISKNAATDERLGSVMNCSQRPPVAGQRGRFLRR